MEDIYAPIIANFPSSSLPMYAVLCGGCSSQSRLAKLAKEAITSAQVQPKFGKRYHPTMASCQALAIVNRRAPQGTASRCPLSTYGHGNTFDIETW